MSQLSNRAKILAIDPGPNQGAWVQWNAKTQKIEWHNIWPINEIINYISCGEEGSENMIVVIEMIQSFGMPVGSEIFETCVNIGRMIEASWYRVERVYRKDIKLHLCGTNRAKDSNIRQALIDRLGSPGVKKAPGITYGLKGDEWQALAICIYWQDTHLT